MFWHQAKMKKIRQYENKFMFGSEQRLETPPPLPLMFAQFPDIVEYALKFIKGHSFVVLEEICVTNTTETVVGLKDMKHHLMRNIPGPNKHEISFGIVQHLVIAPQNLQKKIICQSVLADVMYVSMYV